MIINNFKSLTFESGEEIKDNINEKYNIEYINKDIICIIIQTDMWEGNI